MQARRILEQYQFRQKDQSRSLPGDNEQRAYAQEVLDDLLSSALKPFLLPFLTEKLGNASLAAIQERYPTPSLDYAHWLLALVNASASQVTPWTSVCALYAAGELSEPEQAEIGLIDLLKEQQLRQEPLIQETAQWIENPQKNREQRHYVIHN